jgi:ATP-dependent helicase HrpB
MPPPSLLPIFELQTSLTAALRDPAVPNLLIKAPTGSGKSTQVPQFVLDSGILGPDKRAVVLQPRRIAARMLAARVAKERDARLGQEVGYQVRFENATSAATRIAYLTEGVMLRQFLDDPMLSRIGCVIIDEFHERHLDGDLCLAWASALQKERRPDLKIIVMSATLVSGPLVEFLQPCQMFESAGRTFPVDIRYQAPGRSKIGDTEPVWDQATRACEAVIAEPGFDGDLLVFMPGAYEIRKTITALSGRSFTKNRRICALHGELTPQDQDAAVAPAEQRKIIVSTNVAETSLTIEGVRAVIDGGLARVAAYDPRRGINTLTIQKISRASAEQRAGRAGRLGPGIAVRLWAEREHLHRLESESAEIHRLELSEAVLALRTAAAKAQLDIQWFERPAEASLQRAENLLHELGALDAEGRVTFIGQKMSGFPLHPRFARMLLAAADYGCVREAALCAAVAQGRDILLANKGNAPRQSQDFWELGDVTEFQALLRAFIRAEAANFDFDGLQRLGMHAVATREAARSADQFLRIAKRAGLPINDDVAEPESLAKTLLAAFSDHLGVETGAGSRVYSLAAGYRGHLGKEAHIKPPRLLVATEITEIQGKALQVKLDLVTRVEEDWLRELFPGDLTTGHRASYDAINRRVMNLEETRFRSLVLASRERGEPEEGVAATLLAEEVIAGRLTLNLWNDRVEQWITRLNCLAKWMPDLELPPITEEDRRLLIEQVCLGATAYRQIKDRDVFPALHQWLSYSQREMLDRFAPERYELKNGKTAKIVYDEKSPPSVSAVLQHLYDVKENPRVADGRIVVTVHLLSPAQRPIQTTGDLARFWAEGYPAVKTQLRGRYPRHEWR